MYELLPLVIALAAFIFARKAYMQAKELRARLEALEATGISRSTASAFAAACALNPNRDEAEIAHNIRKASPSAFPNRLIVSLADRALGRDGRMLRALDEIGPGNMSIEGVPFRIDLE